jgi:hypothetical protein
MEEVIQSARVTLDEFPNDCLLHDDLWADASEKANSITRDRKTNSLCMTIGLWEKHVALFYYALPETSPILKGSKFYQIISKALEPYLSTEKPGGL